MTQVLSHSPATRRLQLCSDFILNHGEKEGTQNKQISQGKKKEKGFQGRHAEALPLTAWECHVLKLCHAFHQGNTQGNELGAGACTAEGKILRQQFQEIKSLCAHCYEMPHKLKAMNEILYL